MIKINNFYNNVRQFEIKEAKARMGNYQAQAQLSGTQQLRNQELKQIQNYQSNRLNKQNSLNSSVNLQELNNQLLIADKLNNGVNNAQNAQLYSNFQNQMNNQFSNQNQLNQFTNQKDQQFHQFNTLF